MSKLRDVIIGAAAMAGVAASPAFAEDIRLFVSNRMNLCVDRDGTAPASLAITHLGTLSLANLRTGEKRVVSCEIGARMKGAYEPEVIE